MTATPRPAGRLTSLWITGAAIVLGGVASAEEVTISHGYTNFGELKYGPDIAHLDYVNPNAPKGGEMSQSASGNFDSLNPYTRKGVTGALTTLLWEDIMVRTGDDPYGLYCYLCETVEYPESKDWVIFNLRKDVTFADGSPMTAEDVKFTFELFLDQGITEYKNIVKQYIVSVEVLDTHRIKYSFTEDAPRRDVIGFAGGTNPFSKAWFEETGARLDESTLTPFLGTGPYMVDEVDVGRQLVYRYNPDFWGADHPFNVGQNNFETIRVEYFADNTAAFEGFKAGEFLFRNENTSLLWATGYDFPAIEKGWVKKEEIADGSIGSGQSWIFNLRREKWQDPRVREAVRLMFNFEWSNEKLFYGLYERVNSFWENSDLEARGAPTDAEKALLQPLVDQGLLDASILTDEAQLSPTSGERTLDRRNLRRASALLDEAGWEVGDDGMRRKDGEKLTAVFLSFSPAFDRIINPFVENLVRLGVDAKLERVDVSQYVDRRRSADYDLTNHTFSMSFEPGSGLRQWYDSSTAEDSSRNLMGLENPAVDQLVTNVIEAKSLEEMTTATHALDRTLRALGFWVPQWFKDKHTVAYYDVYRYPDVLPKFALGELSLWWWDEEAAERLRAEGAL